MRKRSSKPVVPYARIDCEIRPLVRLLNARAGIRTLYSCAGHAENEQTYVTFMASGLQVLEALVRALPFHGVRGSLIGNHYEHQILSLTTRIDQDGRLVHDLHVGGRPRYAQRQLLDAVEAALTLEPKPAGNSKRAPVHKRGNVRNCS